MAINVTPKRKSDVNWFKVYALAHFLLSVFVLAALTVFPPALLAVHPVAWVVGLGMVYILLTNVTLMFFTIVIVDDRE